MKNLIALTSLTFSLLLLPSLSQAATPNLYAELLSASSQNSEAHLAVYSAEQALKNLRQENRQKETQFKERYAELEARAKLLKSERQALEAADATQIMLDRDLISDLSLNGAPSNHLKIWNRRRQIQHAQALQATNRRAAFNELAKNEAELKSAQAELDAWYQTSAHHYRATYRILNNRLAKLKQHRTGKQTRTNRLYDVLSQMPQFSSLQANRMARYKARRASSDATVQAALRRARQDNHLTRVHPEVEAQLNRALATRLNNEAALQLRDLIEGLAHDKKPGDIHQQSLDLHLGN